MVDLRGGQLIDVWDDAALAGRRPILIAHRGGAISPVSPECSSAAIRLAAERGFDMVELDVRRSRDGIAVVFHDRVLSPAIEAGEGSVADHDWSRLKALRYRGTEERILAFDQACALCAQNGLGVMIDLKEAGDDDSFVAQIGASIGRHGLSRATITFTGSELAKRSWDGVLFSLSGAERKKVEQGEWGADAPRRFWFGLPRDLSDSEARRFIAAGVLTVPAINTFRYESETHWMEASQDMARLRALGVTGFQMDSIYLDTLRRLSE